MLLLPIGIRYRFQHVAPKSEFSSFMDVINGSDIMVRRDEHTITLLNSASLELCIYWLRPVVSLSEATRLLRPFAVSSLNVWSFSVSAPFFSRSV